MAQQGEDCYFFYNASCAKGLACPFRHQTAALGKELVCAAWLEGSCTDVACGSRHTKTRMDVRTDVPCFFETQPSGCRKANCIYRHVRREQLDESLNVLPKLDLQAWTKPSVQFPVFLQKQAATDASTIKQEKIVINTQEESDQESMNGSPVKQSAPVELKEQRVAAPTLIIKGKRLLDSLSSKDTSVDERVKIIGKERVEKMSEIVTDTEVKDVRTSAERAKIVTLKSSAVTHAATNVGSNESSTQEISKDSGVTLDHGIDLGIKSLEQIQRQRAIDSMKRHVHKRVTESQEQLSPSAGTTISKDSSQKREVSSGDSLGKPTVCRDSPQRNEREGSRWDSSENTQPRFETRKSSEEVSPRKIRSATRVASPERFTSKGVSWNVTQAKKVSRETSSEEISPQRFAHEYTSDEDSSPRRLKAKLLRVVSPRKIVAEDASDDVSPRKFVGGDKADEFSSRRIVVSRYNSSEDSNSEDEQNKPTRPIAKITRPSAKARLGWKSPKRTTKNNDAVSKNEHGFALKFEARLGRDRNNEDFKTSRKSNDNDSSSRERSEGCERPRKRLKSSEAREHPKKEKSPEVREPPRRRVKSPVVVQARRSLSGDPEDFSDHDQSPSPLRQNPSPLHRDPSPLRRGLSPLRRGPSPLRRDSSPLHSTSRGNQSRETEKLENTRLNNVRTTDRHRLPETDKLQDIRPKNAQVADARLRITKRSHKHRHNEETHDKVVIGDKSPAPRDHKKPVVVPLSSIVIPTRRIFVDDGSKSNDKDKSEDGSCGESANKSADFQGETSQVTRLSETADTNKTSPQPVIRGIKSANVRRILLEREKQAKRASEPPQTTLPATEVHVRLVNKAADNIAERARLTTTVSSPAIVIRTLAEIKRDKEEKLRRKQTESDSSEKSSEFRKRRHGVVELYRPPSLQRKEALTESLREKRCLKHYNDISHGFDDEQKVNKRNTNFNDDSKVNKHKSISVVSINKPKVVVDDKKSSSSHKEMDWSNVRSYAEIMADKKAKLLKSSAEPNSSKRQHSHDSSQDNTDFNSRKGLKSDGFSSQHSTSTRSLQSTINEISQSDRQKPQFKPIVLDINTITTIRIPLRPFARKRLKRDDVKKENAIEEEAACASEDNKYDINDKIDKYSKISNMGTVDTDNGISMDAENCSGAGDVNGVAASQPLTGKRRMSKMSSSDTGISENVNKSGRRLTSTEGDLLPDVDDIFSDSFLSDLTQFPMVNNAAIDDDDDFLQEMKDLLS